MRHFAEKDARYATAHSQLAAFEGQQDAEVVIPIKREVRRHRHHLPGAYGPPWRSCVPTMPVMDPALIAATAAVAAAVVSGANIVVTTRFARQREATKWSRDILPDVVLDLSAAAFAAYREIEDADWGRIEDVETAQWTGMNKWREGLELFYRLEVIATPDLVKAASDLLNAVDGIRLARLSGVDLANPGPEWSVYKTYGEAKSDFINEARAALKLDALT